MMGADGERWAQAHTPELPLPATPRRVPLSGGEEFELGEEEVLFTGNFAVEVGGRNQFYGVTPDGQPFIMIAPQTEGTPVNVVLNWFEELKERVPGGR